MSNIAEKYVLTVKLSTFELGEAMNDFPKALRTLAEKFERSARLPEDSEAFNAIIDGEFEGIDGGWCFVPEDCDVQENEEVTKREWIEAHNK